MTVLERLENWRKSEAITPAQYSTIAAVVRNDRFSLFVELNALLYLGVVSGIGGLAWTIETYFENLGDAAIILTLTLIFGASLYYCFARSLPYSSERVESPNFVFDYVLYLSALTFGIGLGYIEFRFQLLKDSWDNYLLISAFLYFFLSYRFDNRFVLSLALSTLAGWFGLRTTRWGLLQPDGYRIPAIVYSLVIALAGTALYWRGLKRHFLRTYLHVAANVLFVALLSGVGANASDWGYLLVVLMLSGLAIYGGFRLKELAFAGYGTVYGYIGVSIRLLHGVREPREAMMYFVVSGALVIGFVAWLAAKSARSK